ncbi:MAG: division/cell wall cluster transcriptional repressor MraZ [Bacteroidales bacterium]|jgi:MraZ protein|nr:division/cell wall cluster transcriptional repressor MraZ [Bacteroidales bacterium]
MTIFTGEYDCKVDAKGRIMLPAAFRKQMGEVDLYQFVIKKDMYESCLELYTAEEWERQNKLILKNTNPYDPEHRQFIRDFRMGIAELECDQTGRILVPARLLKQAGISKDAVLSGSIGKIEIWSPDLYGNSGGDMEAKRDRAKRIMSGATYNLDDV